MNKKILIVDDDKDLVDTLQLAFESSGYATCAAYSANEGLQKLVQEKPDLIILDVMMETDTAGFEFAFQVRNKRETSKYTEFIDIPIIILTAINQSTNSRFSLDEDDSFLPKIDKFLTKPINIDELINHVKDHL